MAQPFSGLGRCYCPSPISMLFQSSTGRRTDGGSVGNLAVRLDRACFRRFEASRSCCRCRGVGVGVGICTWSGSGLGPRGQTCTPLVVAPMPAALALLSRVVALGDTGVVGDVEHGKRRPSPSLPTRATASWASKADDFPPPASVRSEARPTVAKGQPRACAIALIGHDM